MRMQMSRMKAKVAGAAMAAMLAVSPLAVISMSMVTGCGGGGCCLPTIPCKCALQFGAGMLGIWLLRNGEGGIGRPGLHCWDLNANNTCDVATEDMNGDGVCDALDCQGLPGEAGQDIPGIDGLNCWDLNADGVADPNEDINGDGAWDAYDCRGDDGNDGKNGHDGLPGSALFDLFIEDFFTYGHVTDQVAGQEEVILVQEPVLAYRYEYLGPVAFRVSVPEVYTEGHPVTLRIFFWREAFSTTGSCTTLRFDAFRLIPNDGIERYGTPVWLLLEPGEMTNPGMLVIDLPLNTATGLNFPNNLYAPQMLAFEIGISMGEGYIDLDADLTVLGAEIFESVNASDTSISGVTVFTNGDMGSFCESGNGWAN